MRCRPDYDRAAEVAYKCLVRLDIRELPVRPMEMLRRCRGTVIYTYREAAALMNMSQDEFERGCGDADAFTIRGDGQRYVVCYRDDGNPARLNFTLAHELGHIALGHRDEGPAEEKEADHFALHLLCPAPVIGRMAEKWRPLTAERIAAACYVTVAAGKSIMRCHPCRIDEEMWRQVDELLGQAADLDRTPVGYRGAAQHPVRLRGEWQARG